MSLAFQPGAMHLEYPIQFYALYHSVQRSVVPQGNFSCFLRNSSDKLLAGLADMDGTTSITSNCIYQLQVQIFILR